MFGITFNQYVDALPQCIAKGVRFLTDYREELLEQNPGREVPRWWQVMPLDLKELLIQKPCNCVLGHAHEGWRQYEPEAVRSMYASYHQFRSMLFNTKGPYHAVYAYPELFGFTVPECLLRCEDAWQALQDAWRKEVESYRPIIVED